MRRGTRCAPVERCAVGLKTTEGATNHGAISLAFKIFNPARRAASVAFNSIWIGKRDSAQRRSFARLKPVRQRAITGIEREDHEETPTRRDRDFVPFIRGVRPKRAFPSASPARAGAGQRPIFRSDAERARGIRNRPQCERLRPRSRRSCLGCRFHSCRLCLRYAERQLIERQAACLWTDINAMGGRSRRFGRRRFARRQAR
jgi:hypothetical protein